MDKDEMLALCGRIRESVDIVKFISDDLGQLREVEPNLWLGVCPLCGEGNFRVIREPPVYSCKDCGLGGDVIKYLMDADELLFVDALTVLEKLL